MSFFVREQLGPNHWKTKRAHPAIDGSAITKCGGHLVVLQGGLESARLQQPPYRYGWDQSGNRTLHTASLQEFIAHAREAIERAESLVAEQQAAMSDGG